MSPSTELLGHLATGTLSAVVGAGILLLVTWDRQVSIAAAEYRMRRAERQSEELLRAALRVSDAVQPRAIGAGSSDDHVTGELLAVGHVEVDEDAPADDTDRTGLWRVLLGLASDLVDRVHDWLPNLLRERRERDQVGSGEQATSADPFAELLAHVEAPTTEADELALLDQQWQDVVAKARAEAAAEEPEPVRIVRNNRYRDPGMTGQFPLVKVVGDKVAGRHRAAPEPEMPAVNAAIPTQREGGDQ